MRTISIIGGKGGIGKTTLTANLSAFLAGLGYKVTAIDGNLTTPNLGLHIGLHLAPITIHDVLRGEPLSKSLYYHPLGFSVIPGSLNVYDLMDINPDNLLDVLNKINSDFVFIDSAAGLGREALMSLRASDEVLVVTNPELSAVTDALRTIKVSENLGKKIIGIAVNRRGRSKHELSTQEIQDALSYPVIAEIPEDKAVPESISKKIPLVVYKPNSKAAIEIKNLAFAILGIDYRIKRDFLSQLFSW